jgi:Propanediol utilization protein
MKRTVPVGISNKHLHISQKDLEVLFGPGHQLTPTKELGQPGQFACAETVEMVGSKGSFGKVRILGPIRPETQVEISLTDAIQLGIKAPIRESGELEETPGLTLVGPAGKIEMERGVIIAARHIHMDPKTAEEYGVKDKDLVTVRVSGQRGLLFEEVLVRVREDFALEMHVDTDEGNAAMLSNSQEVEII